MIELDNAELAELRNCKLFQKLSKRHRKIVEWQIKQYLEIESISDEEIPVEIFYVKGSKAEPINFNSSQDYLVTRRELENLSNVDFDFGLYFYMENYMPFFTDQDVGLFKTIEEDEVEPGDMCLIKMKVGGSYWLTFKESNGFFDLDGNFLGEDEEIVVIGTLVNIETR